MVVVNVIVSPTYAFVGVFDPVKELKETSIGWAAPLLVTSNRTVPKVWVVEEMVPELENSVLEKLPIEVSVLSVDKTATSDVAEVLKCMPAR